VPRFAKSVRHSALRSARLAAALLLVGASASCFDWNRSTRVEITDIRRYISGAQTASGREAVFNPGNPPVGGDGPALSATVPAIVLKGGSAQIPFSSPTAFSRVLLAVDGVDGYWDLELDGPTTLTEVLVVYAQDVGAPAFWMRYAGGSPGSVGTFAQANTAFLGNGTGPVQVNITWNSAADVDLYVVDPHGDELFYARRRVASGGELDIDSNAACFADGPRAENIFWPFGVVPPRGEYTVRVNYWSSCGVPSTDYVVTIRVTGGVPQTYRGRLTGLGGLPASECQNDPCQAGGEGAGYRIAAFTF
jgi:hypothetical protein